MESDAENCDFQDQWNIESDCDDDVNIELKLPYPCSNKTGIYAKENDAWVVESDNGDLALAALNLGSNFVPDTFQDSVGNVNSTIGKNPTIVESVSDIDENDDRLEHGDPQSSTIPIPCTQADALGRKIPLWSVAIPHGISWILIEYGTYPWQLYLSRILSGLGSGGAFTLVPIYIAEISESHVRGRLGSLLMLSANAGFLFAFLAGHYLTYHTIPYIGIVLSIVYLITFVFLPETPTYLLRNQKVELAEKSFKFYRSVGSDDVMPDKVAKEWDELKKRVAESLETKDEASFDFKELFTTRAGRKAFIIGVALIFMHEFCGVFTMLNYTANIFRHSGSTISPQFSAIIVGFIQLLGTYVATFLVDRLGRKILLITSAIGTSVCLALLGSYSYLNSIGIDVTSHSWIAIATFSGMMFLAAVGLIPLMFVVIAEVMPEKVRSVGCTICFCMSWILAFVMVKFFESAATVIGMHGWVYLFSIATMLGAIFIVVFIPETKGKNYAEIAAILNR